MTFSKYRKIKTVTPKYCIQQSYHIDVIEKKIFPSKSWGSSTLNCLIRDVDKGFINQKQNSKKHTKLWERC